MNRIKLGPLATQPVDSPTAVSDLAQADCGVLAANAFLPFDNAVDISSSSLFLPLHYEKNYQYPLLVWLHDNGNDSSQVHRVMQQVSVQNYVAVAPQAPTGSANCGYYWEQTDESISQAADTVLATIDKARCQANISSERIFIAGCGAAGTMAFRVAFTHPDIFAGVASINGPLPQGSAPLGRWSSSRNLEVFWSHYRNSEHFDQNTLCTQLKLLHVAGFSVCLRQYPGNLEEVSPPALAEINRWVMQLSDSTIS